MQRKFKFIRGTGSTLKKYFQSTYEDCSSKKPVEKGKAEYELDGADDDKEGEGDGVNKSLGVNWNQSCMRKKGGN